MTEDQEIRLRAIQMANGDNLPFEKMVERAKKIEKYILQGDDPIKSESADNPEQQLLTE